MPSGVIVSFPLNFYRVLGKYCGGKEEGTMVFSAVQAVTDSNSIRISGGNKPDFTAQATA